MEKKPEHNILDFKSIFVNSFCILFAGKTAHNEQFFLLKLNVKI